MKALNKLIKKLKIKGARLRSIIKEEHKVILERMLKRALRKALKSIAPHSDPDYREIRQ